MAHPTASEPVAIHGPALRAIRGLAGMSCTALARAVGADVSFLARIERGEKRRVRSETHLALCRVLGLTDPRAISAEPYPASGPTVVPSQRSTRSAA